MIKKYKPRINVIEAAQWDGGNDLDIEDFLDGAF